MTSDAILTNAHAALFKMLHQCEGDVMLTSPYITYPVARDLAKVAKASTSPWSLLTKLDPVAVASGFLSLAGLRELLDAGVIVRTSPSLHAKVYLAGHNGLSSSGNLTKRGLGTAAHPNQEFTVRLAPTQVDEARTIIGEWWDGAAVVDDALLAATDSDARKVRSVPAPDPDEGADEDEDTIVEAAALLAEARGVNLWAKAVYGDEDPPDWSGDEPWIASSKRGKPSFAIGDLVLIYARDLHLCNAVVEVTENAIWAPDVIAQDRPQEDAERWPWLNYVRGRLWVASEHGITPSDLGFTPQGLQGGHRRLELAEFAAAVRHLAGETV
ncbi:hypothetical protein [Cellulomonas sp. HZM]|uniref:hypothetical protein n=1 Tax=Cellulomonas sp. HZM TaxID=1454010 RepID=UPI000493974D|nr:hypothetical protein [Cellulomonas sp. HZM]